MASISSTFYELLFPTKVFCAAFLLKPFGTVIFWRKNIGVKAAHLMLVKLTRGDTLPDPIQVRNRWREQMARGFWPTSEPMPR